MTKAEKIKQAYATAKNYPELAQKLVDAGVESYTVEVSSNIMIYRLAGGETHIHSGTIEPRAIATAFNHDLTCKAIKDNQEAKTDYPTFMLDIAKAGVRFYDAIL